MLISKDNFHLAGKQEIYNMVSYSVIFCTRRHIIMCHDKVVKSKINLCANFYCEQLFSVLLLINSLPPAYKERGIVFSSDSPGRGYPMASGPRIPSVASGPIILDRRHPSNLVPVFSREGVVPLALSLPTGGWGGEGWGYQSGPIEGYSLAR